MSPYHSSLRTSCKTCLYIKLNPPVPHSFVSLVLKRTERVRLSYPNIIAIHTLVWKSPDIDGPRILSKRYQSFKATIISCEFTHIEAAGYATWTLAFCVPRASIHVQTPTPSSKRSEAVERPSSKRSEAGKTQSPASV